MMGGRGKGTTKLKGWGNHDLCRETTSNQPDFWYESDWVFCCDFVRSASCEVYAAAKIHAHKVDATSS